MDSLVGLISFVRTAETLSFVGAGRVLGISASAVGKNVARLEAQLGVRLIQRSTRRLSLTEEGILFHERCRRILDDLNDAQAAVARTLEAPRGRLRISLPTAGYHFLIPALPDFTARYPEIELDLDFNDQLVDVIEGGFDAVIRSGDLPDSRLMARRLGPFRFLLCAAPSYLARRGTPAGPADLARHACLRFRFPTSGKLHDWAQVPDMRQLPVSLVANNIEGLRLAACQGLGIVYLPDFLVRDALAQGTLVTLLDEHPTDHGHFSILWPSSRNLSPKLRVFVDFMGRRLFRDAA